MLTKKDLESKFHLSANTVYKILQVCSLGTKKKEYTEEEVEEYFVPTRQMLNTGKTCDEVFDYFKLKNSSGTGAGDIEDEEFNVEGFAANQATDATEALGVAVAQTVADMVESGVKQVAPYIPALVMQTLNQELNSGEIKQAFDNMRSQIKSSSNGNGSGAAFFAPEEAGLEKCESVEWQQGTALTRSLSREVRIELERVIRELIAAHQGQLASQLAQSLQQLELKEQHLLAYERGLEGKAEILTQLFIQRIKSSALCEVSLGNLELWRQQAEAIEPSPKHLVKIDRLITKAREQTAGNKDALPTVEIPVRDYVAMLCDQQEFNELAFRLIRGREKEDDSTNAAE